MYKKIMVPLDGSKLAECVLPHVDGFVSDCQVETIVFVRVIEPIPTSYSEMSSTSDPRAYKYIRDNAKKMEEEREASAKSYLEKVVSRVKQDKVECEVEVLVGKVADSLVDYVAANAIDLVLIATHGRSGIGRWVRGSVADRVLRSSRAPVLMVRAEEKISGGKV